MGHLLDTHAFLWATLDSEQLGPAARAVLMDPEADRRLSVGSIWEIAIKVSIGRLSLPVDLNDFIRTQRRELAVSLLGIEVEHATRVGTLPFHHRDPFDRLLVAQALCDDLTVVSRDEALDAYGVRRVW